MIDNQDVFTDKCIRCKRYDVEINNFRYAKTHSKLMSGTEVTKWVNMPVCVNCAQKFRRYITIEKFLDKFKSALICINVFFYTFPIIGLIYLIPNLAYLGSNPGFLVNYILTLLAPISITVVIFLLIYLTKHSSSSPRKYIDIKSSGKIIIKDEEYRQKVAAQIIETAKIVADPENKFFCPNCGTERSIFEDFCNNCGKDLRALKIKKEKLDKL